MSITGGSVERNESGNLEAYIETMAPFQSLQKFNEKLGLHSLRLLSKSESVSSDPDNTTVFASSTDHVLPQGEMILDLMSWKEIPIPMNIKVNALTKAVGYLEDNFFHGAFTGLLTYHGIDLKIGMNGEFTVRLA